MAKVLCINDQGRPNEIPVNKWIKKDVEYTVTRAVKIKMMGGVLVFELEEIDLRSCEPYRFFLATRFAAILDLDKLIEEGVIVVYTEEEFDRIMKEPAIKELELQEADL